MLQFHEIEKKTSTHQWECLHSWQIIVIILVRTNYQFIIIYSRQIVIMQNKSMDIGHANILIM